jgi:hypothetical protein
MITDAEVETLYRCLLGRAPESADTIAAFRAYYGEFTRGRAAILQSAEFSGLFAGIAGAAPARLAQGFLRRAGGAAAPDAYTARPALAGAMRLMLRAHDAVHLAVVVGDAGVNITDLLPLESARPAVLHVAPHFPTFLPQTGSLPGGATLFRARFDTAGLASILRECDVQIDVLALLRDVPEWLAALRGVIAPRAILLGEPGLARETNAWPGAERALTVDGLDVRCVGGWFLPVSFAPHRPVAPLPPAPRPSLWLAAIVRDEAACVVNMLQSAAPVVDGFVVVDTGSSDDTLARARAYLDTTGKPFVLRAHPADRFDDMRNAALDLVPQTADWVIMLDADEELCAEDHAPLLGLLAGATCDAFALPRYNYAGADKSGEVSPYPDRQVRLLRHGCTPPIRYSGAVHEKVLHADIRLLPLDASVLGQGSGGPHIHHLVRRFRSAAAEAAKQERYREIARCHAQANLNG